MKLTDWAVRAFVLIAFLVLLVGFASTGANGWAESLVLLSFAVVGIWAILFPQGVLGWAKSAHPSIDVNDRSMWWLPRLIGAVCWYGFANHDRNRDESPLRTALASGQLCMHELSVPQSYLLSG
jgi:hypothetical protein